MASIGLHWNLFNGMADKARIEESSHLLERAHADEQRMDSAVRLEVRHAWADLGAAQQRIEVAKAAVAEAEESLEDHSEPLRIRYEQRYGPFTKRNRGTGKPDPVPGSGA